MKHLIESIKQNEGFSSKPYPDPLHGWEVPTFGYGQTYITEAEAEMILINRILSIQEQLGEAKPVFNTLTQDRQNALVEMAYQLGVAGTLNFRNMWQAIEAQDFPTAYDEALNSKWAKQTPSRAKSVAKGLL